MGNRLILFAMVTLGLLPFPVQRHARACTTFQLNHEGQIYVGKNYDWMVEDGLIIVNKRGVTKTAMESTVDNTGLGTPAKWTSKYGSVTFTQYGRELGPGGMNEAGLVVESMGLFQNTPNRKYPDPDERVSILVQQWRQYQLDNFASVKEVIEYTQQNNRQLIENAFTKTLFFPKLSTEQLDTLSKYPDTFICGN